MARIAAECPNVYVKVGAGAFPHTGLGFDKRDKPPTSVEVAEALSEVYLWTIETFGCDRCMFEGVSKRNLCIFCPRLAAHAPCVHVDE